MSIRMTCAPAPDSSKALDSPIPCDAPVIIVILSDETALEGYDNAGDIAEGHRVHANDKEDDSFTDYEDADLVNLAAYLAELDDGKIIPGYRFIPPVYRPTFARPQRAELTSSIQITDITQTVVRMALDKGVSTEAAENAMIAKAEEIGLKKVAQQKVSTFLAKQTVQMPHLSIFQFCNPMDARLMVIADPVFSSYMPCRISLVEDADGKLWLMMLNLDMLINSKLLPPEVTEIAIQRVRDAMQTSTSGARVLGTASTDKLDLLRELRVDQAIGDLAQGDDGRFVVLFFHQGIGAVRDLARPLGCGQDHFEAVLDVFQAVFNGNSCHVSNSN